MDAGRQERAVKGTRRGCCGVAYCSRHCSRHIVNGLSSVSERRCFIIHKWKTFCLLQHFYPVYNVPPFLHTYAQLSMVWRWQAWPPIIYKWDRRDPKRVREGELSWDWNLSFCIPILPFFLLSKLPLVKEKLTAVGVDWDLNLRRKWMGSQLNNSWSALRKM